MLDMSKTLSTHALMVISWSCPVMMHTIICMLIFHAMVMQTGPKSTSRGSKKIEFLFVWWFSLDNNEMGGWKTKKLHQIGFVEGDTAFGFVDPADVIRAVRLIPQFSEGHTKDLLSPSSTWSVLEKDKDWVHYYVNM